MTDIPRRPAGPGGRRAPWLVVVATLIAGGCSDVSLREGRPLWTEGQADGKRAIVDVTWNELWTLGGADDDLLARPVALTAVDGGVVFGDGYDGRVLAVGLDGAIRWSFGRKGEGPGEFQRIQSIQVDRNGVVHVLDNENRRITLLGAGGEWLGDVSVPDGMWFSMVPLEDGYILEGSDPEAPFRRVIVQGNGEAALRPAPPDPASDGAPAPPPTWSAEVDGPAFGLPWKGLTDLHLLQRQGRVITARDGRWAYTFHFGNGWFAHRGVRALDYTGQNVEHANFPEIVSVSTARNRTTRLRERPECSNCSGWIRGDTVSFHFGGRTPDAYRLVDRYEWGSGTYFNSLRLPAAANQVVQVQDTYVLLVQTPFPALSAWTVGPAEEGSAEAGAGLADASR